MESLGKVERIICPKCGGSKFKILTEQIVYDLTNNEGKLKPNRPLFEYSDASIENESVKEVICLKCGQTVFQKYQKKPISKKAWEDFWENYLADYIIGFEHYAVNCEEDADEMPQEWFLRGMAKGMWTLYNLIEREMVEK